MARARAMKWGLIILAAILVLIVGAIVGFQAAVGLLKGKVLEALGPNSEVKELRVRWSAVELDGLRIKARRGWPAADTLRAERVVIVPSLKSLLSDRIQVGSVTVVRPYLSALRTRDGKLQVAPGLLAGPATEGKAAARSVTISRITLEDGVMELFDATVAQPPLKIRLEKIQAAMRDVVAPALTGKSRFDLTALVKGLQRDGRATVSGWVEVASKERGALDLDLDSEVKQNRLRAPGKVVISDLEFTPTRGVLDTFMGVPRAAVINFLKNRENKIAINFILEGDINNPRFALNEAFATRLATGLAENLGVSIRGVAEGVGTLGQKGLEAAGEAAKGVGSALQQLLGGPKKR
ncbi:MAG: hypothetical protein HYW08_08380 [candidate division NC10 bacterium]|nr:hypothetical protein [candidate division NC10 bacterium]